MADNPEQKPEEEPFSIHSIWIDTWKAKKPSLFLMGPPPKFFITIGLIVTHWGMFETIFEGFLIALLKAAGNTDEAWRGLSFRRRRVLFQKAMLPALSSMPTVSAHLQSILDDSEPIYLKRNLVAHGRLSIKLKTLQKEGKTEGSVSLICAGRYKRQDIHAEFSWDELDDLFYNVTNLAGRLNVLSTAGEGLGLSSNDKSLLRAFLEANHPTFPMPTNMPPQQKSLPV